MYDEKVLMGWGKPAKRPSWRPLEQFLPRALRGGFMWMHTLMLEGGIKVQAYKHSETRRYLLIDTNGDSWESLGERWFRRMRHSDAIEQVFDPFWLLNHATEKQQDALRRALEAACERGDGDDAAGAHILPSSPADPFRTLPKFDLDYL
jgi:hypothetical protein